MYGGGPIAQAELYDPAHPIKLLVESGGQFEDLPRRADHSAVIGDPRNDSNLIISGLHAAFLRFHNHAVDAVATPGADPIETFTEARRLTTWHYQWLVVNQVLPNFVGQPMVDDVLRHGPRCFHSHAGGRTSRSSSPARPTGSGTAWCGRRTARTSPATTATRSSA